MAARKLKRARARAKVKAATKAKPKSSFSDYARPAASSTSTYRPAPTAVAEDDFMASLLSSVAAAPTTINRNSKSSPEIPSSDGLAPSSDSSFFGSRKRYGVEEDDDAWDSKRGVMGKKPRVSDVTVVPDENVDMAMDIEVDGVVVKAEPLDEEDDDMDIKVRESRPLTSASTKINGATVPNGRRRVVNSSSVKHVVAKLEPIALPESSLRQPIANGKPPTPGSAHWSAVQESLLPTPKSSEFDEVKAPQGSVRAENVLEDDGNLRIFWLDYMEQDGVVHFVGKVLDRQSGKHVSACVSVSGIQRNLFVKPRAKVFCESSHTLRIELTVSASGHETDIEVTRTGVYQDFDSLRQKAGVEEWAAKFAQRKYAFEDQALEKGESEWMKVVYGFDRE